MKIVVTFCLVVALPAIVSAQSAPGDEQQIRDLIAKYDAGQTRDMATSSEEEDFVPGCAARY